MFSSLRYYRTSIGDTTLFKENGEKRKNKRLREALFAKKNCAGFDDERTKARQHTLTIASLIISSNLK